MSLSGFQRFPLRTVELSIKGYSGHRCSVDTKPSQTAVANENTKLFVRVRRCCGYGQNRCGEPRGQISRLWIVHTSAGFERCTNNAAPQTIVQSASTHHILLTQLPCGWGPPPAFHAGVMRLAWPQAPRKYESRTINQILPSNWEQNEAIQNGEWSVW